MQSIGSRYLKALQETARMVNSGSDAKEILQWIVKNTAKAMNAPGCSLMLLDSNKERLLPIAAYGLSDWYLRKGFLEIDRSLPENLEGKAAVVLNVAEDPRMQYPELAQKAGITSLLSVPLVQQGEVAGVIRVYAHEPRHFSSQDKDFVAAVSDLSALALEKAELREMLTKREKTSEMPEGSHFASDLTKPKNFAHPSEEEFAKLLDFYRIEWLYEPRSFPLQQEGDKVVEMLVLSKRG